MPSSPPPHPGPRIQGLRLLLAPVPQAPGLACAGSPAPALLTSSSSSPPPPAARPPNRAPSSGLLGPPLGCQRSGPSAPLLRFLPFTVIFPEQTPKASRSILLWTLITRVPALGDPAAK